MEVLQSELKLVREDLHRVAMELQARSGRVTTLQAKHGTLLTKHGADALEEGRSQVRLHALLQDDAAVHAPQSHLQPRACTGQVQEQDTLP